MATGAMARAQATWYVEAGNFSASGDGSFGNLHLLPGPPCIDAGDPNSTDQDGTRLDVGAIPFDTSYCGQPGIYFIAKENSGGCIPAISRSGTPSVAGPDNFHVQAITGAGLTNAVKAAVCTGARTARSPHIRARPWRVSRFGHQLHTPGEQVHIVTRKLK